MNTRTRPNDGGLRGIMKFDSTVNMGTIIQILVIIGSVTTVYTGLKTDQVQQRADLELVRAVALSDRTKTNETLSDLKADIKDLRSSNNEILQGLAILRGRAAENPRAGDNTTNRAPR